MKSILISISIFLTGLLNAQNYIGNQEDINKIINEVEDFSRAVMDSDFQSIGSAYTADAKIFPNTTDIIKGRDAIVDYWTLPEGVKIKHHHVSPEEIKIIGDEAYDYGYYEGITLRPDGTESKWKGKYVIVWKKIDAEWKIYLDIWNSISLEYKE